MFGALVDMPAELQIRRRHLSSVKPRPEGAVERDERTGTHEERLPAVVHEIRQDRGIGRILTKRGYPHRDERDASAHADAALDLRLYLALKRQIEIARSPNSPV